MTEMRHGYQEHERVYAVTEAPSRTKQSMGAECDVNEIVRRFERTGVLPHVSGADYADVSEMGDYRTAMETVREAEKVFMTLPVELRQECDHNAAVFIDWVQDPANAEKLVEYGLVEGEPPTAAPAEPAKPQPAGGVESN